MSTLSPALAATPISLRRADRAATVLLVLVAVTLATLLGGRALGVRPLIERTGSMAPAISIGDLLISHTVNAGALRRGDIVTFPNALHPGTPTTHRVVALRRVGATLDVTTKGDANPATESWSVPARGEVRRVTLTIPEAGYVVAALGDRWVRIALLLGACAGLGAVALRRIWRP